MSSLEDLGQSFLQGDEILERRVGICRAAPYLISARNLNLKRLCAVVAQVFRVESAALALSMNGVSHIVAAHGRNIQFRTYFSFFAPSEGAKADDMLVADATQNPLAQHLAHTVWTGAAGFFARRTILVEEGCSVVLGVYGPAPRPDATTEQLQILDQLCGMMRAAIVAMCKLHIEMERLGGLSLEQACAEIVGSDDEELLFDSDLRLVCVSFAAQVALGDRLLGVSDLSDIIRPAARDNVTWLARRTLQTGISPPELEIADVGGEGRRVVRMLLAPLTVQNGARYLVLRRQEATTLVRAEDAVARRANNHNAPLPDPDQPVFEFLDETLVPRRRANARKDITYITLRSWRKPIAPFQMKALSALKGNLPSGVAHQIGVEMINEVRSLVGVEAFSAVVPMPCGHERPNGCLSVEIGASIARATGLRFVQALATKPRKGSSHPKENLRRPPLTLEVKPNQPVLLVDDVATSGVHMEDAIHLLRPHAGSVLALAWIGGSVN